MKRDTLMDNSNLVQLDYSKDRHSFIEKESGKTVTQDDYFWTLPELAAHLRCSSGFVSKQIRPSVDYVYFTAHHGGKFAQEMQDDFITSPGLSGINPSRLPHVFMSTNGVYNWFKTHFTYGKKGHMLRLGDLFEPADRDVVMDIVHVSALHNQISDTDKAQLEDLTTNQELLHACTGFIGFGGLDKAKNWPLVRLPWVLDKASFKSVHFKANKDYSYPVIARRKAIASAAGFYRFQPKGARYAKTLFTIPDLKPEGSKKSSNPLLGSLFVVPEQLAQDKGLK